MSQYRIDHMKAFLECFTTEELLELRECSLFLTWMLRWIDLERVSTQFTCEHIVSGTLEFRLAYVNPAVDIWNIAQGPDFVLQCFKRDTRPGSSVSHWSMNGHFIMESLGRIQEARKINDKRWEAEYVEKVIMQPVNGGTDLCMYFNWISIC